MRAELIAVGSELLQFGRRDTNSDWLGERLIRMGFRVTSRIIVGDDDEMIAEAVRGATARADLVVVSGGLGPTEDDRTREGVAGALGLDLESDPEARARLEARFRARGFRFHEEHARQAERPRGALWIENPVGSAPGFRLTAGQTTVVALPGVPAELKAVFESGVAPLLAGRSRGPALSRRVLKVAGRTESSVDASIRDLYDETGVTVSVLALPTAVEILVQAEGDSPEDSHARLEELDGAMAERLGRDLFGRDDDTLAGVVGALLRERGRTVATAESCTGGLLAGAITAVPGSSEWFRGGVVAYSDDLKIDLAGVAKSTIEEHGAVSAPVAEQLARGARVRLRADSGVGVTGIAGPGGGSADKPVGLVYVAVDDREGTVSHRLLLPGDRDLVRGRSVTAAVDLLRRRLEGWR